MKLPELCIYCQKKLTGDSIEGIVWTCHDCPAIPKEDNVNYPIAYCLDDYSEDGELEDMGVYLKTYMIHVNYKRNETSICLHPNPYYNVLLTLKYIPELDLLDRDKLFKWAEGLHKIVAFS